MTETVSSPLRTPANLIPCPYVPRIANEPSTWPITVHCGTSKIRSLHRTTISASLLLRYSPLPSTSSFLTIRIPHGTLQNNGVAGGRTNRPAERTTLHFYISMQNGGKKPKHYQLANFSFFLQLPTFLLKYLMNFIEYRGYIARVNFRNNDSLQQNNIVNIFNVAFFKAKIHNF